MTSSLDRLVPPLLEHLRAEEQLLRDALAGLSGVHAALRAGDLAAVAAAGPDQDATARALRDAEAARVATTVELARAVGLAPEGLTLSALAAALPEPWAAAVAAARDRLTAAATGLEDFRLRNANLIGQLRSYFRGVLSSLTHDDAPVRYGPSGAIVPPASGGAIQARG